MVVVVIVGVGVDVVVGSIVVVVEIVEVVLISVVVVGMTSVDVVLDESQSGGPDTQLEEAIVSSHCVKRIHSLASKG
jgi:hypothetical protein